MLLYALLACASSPAPVDQIKVDKTYPGSDREHALSIFRNPYNQAGWSLTENYTTHVWYGASTVLTAEVFVTDGLIPGHQPNPVNQNDWARVWISPKDLDPTQGGHPWVEFDISQHGRTVWADAGCWGFKVKVEGNFEADLWEQPDHHGNCRAYLNGAHPTGSDAGYLIPVGPVVRPKPAQ